jgi:nitrous oxidase accessory protein NosD
MFLSMSRNKSGRRATAAGRSQLRKQFRPGLESLEARDVPSANPLTVYVSGAWATQSPGTSVIVTDPNIPGHPSAVVGTDAFATIQDAINHVADGGTVDVLKGTYNESPNVNHSLTLEAVDGRAQTTIALQPSSPLYLGALTIAGPDVKVEGFTIRGFDASAATNGLAATDILVNSGVHSVVVSNNRLLVGATDPNSSNGDDGIGLLTTYNTSTDVASVSVIGNLFQPLNGSAGRAFDINPGVDQFTFSLNTITGNFSGLALTQAKHGVVAFNRVAGTGSSAGLGTWGYPDPTVYGQTLFLGNWITGTNKAIAVYETNDVTIVGNTLSQNNYGVWVGSLGDVTGFDPSTIHVNFNNITGNKTAGVANETTTTLDARFNWWGTASRSGVASQVEGPVNFTPWLRGSGRGEGD